MRAMSESDNLRKEYEKERSLDKRVRGDRESVMGKGEGSCFFFF